MSPVDHNIKITYIPAQYRIRVELRKADVMAFAEPPLDIMERAKRKLENEVQAGRLAFYRFFEVRLDAIWKKMRQDTVPDDALVGVTLATGAPDMPGLKISAGDGDVLGYISIGAEQDVVATWRFPLFKLTVGKLLQDLGSTAIPDPAHLQALLLKAAQGSRVIKQPIHAIPQLAKDAGQSKIHYITGRDEVAVVVYDVAKFQDDEAITAWTDELAQEIRRIDAATGRTFKFLRSEIIRALRSAYRGVERFGLDLPMTLLAAYAPSGPSRNQGVRRGGAQVASRLRGVCELDISDGGMVARIAAFHYEKLNTLKPVTIEDWSQYFAALGVIHGVDEGELQRFYVAVAAEHPVTDIIIARGTNPKAASAAYLYPTYSSATAKADQTSFRDAQQRSLVRKGDVIAEVRYEQPAISGTNVYGEAIKPPQAPVLEVETSEGVESPDGRIYVATTSGMPKIVGNRIDLLAALSFEGDVNLASGNVYFDGAGEINGSIESGAVVEVTGDLHVKGMIHAANVRCGGNLIVDNGIIGDEHSLVHVQGDVVATFIENASLRCIGELSVAKAIIGSRVSCHSLKITDTNGLVAGGVLECWEKLEVANLGRDASDTSVVVGRPQDLARRIHALENRIARLVRVLDAEKSGAAYVDEKDAVRRSKKQQVRLTGMKARIPRLKRVVRKIQNRIAALQEAMVYNEDACIIVTQTLSKRCRIEICGKTVSTTVSLQGVKILPKKLKDSFFRALDEDEHQEAG